MADEDLGVSELLFVHCVKVEAVGKLVHPLHLLLSRHPVPLSFTNAEDFHFFFA